MLQVNGLRGPVRVGNALGLFAVVVMGCVGACSLHQNGVNPPDNRIFLPGGALIQPCAGDPSDPSLCGGDLKGSHWMYVVNSNSDLRYNAGTVAAVDLSKVRQDGDCSFRDQPDCPVDNPASGSTPRWPRCDQNPKFLDPRYVPPANPPYKCCFDSLDPNILNCDEQRYINDQRNSTIRIGSFGGRPVMQEMPPGGAVAERMFVPVRGDTSITFMNVDATADSVAFSCTGSRTSPNPPSRYAACDDHWRITRADDPVNGDSAASLPDDQVYNVPAEPYAVAVDSRSHLLYVGHLRGGDVSLIDLGDGQENTRPNLATVYHNLLPADPNGLEGITGLTIKDPVTGDGCFGAIYATSRFRPVVGSFVVYGLDGCPRSATLPGSPSVQIVGRGEIISTGIAGAEARGIEFVRRKSITAPECKVTPPDPACAPDRFFVLQRTPPALVAIDANTLVPFSVVEVCQGPTHLVQQLDAQGATLALLVTCFDAGEVDVVDPWVPRIRSIVPVGRGPITTVLDPADPTRGYVVGFGGNNIVVLHLDAATPGKDRVVQRIGFPSVTPREIGPGQP